LSAATFKRNSRLQLGFMVYISFPAPADSKGIGGNADTLTLPRWRRLLDTTGTGMAAG
jgi:hypothetical protein